MKRKIIIVFIIIALISAAYLLVVKNFDSIINVNDKQLRLMVVQLGQSQPSEAFHEQSRENTNRIIDILGQYKYLNRIGKSDAEAFTDETLIYMTFYNDEERSTMQIVSNGNILISDRSPNEKYIALGGSKLFNELYEIIEINDELFDIPPDLQY